MDQELKQEFQKLNQKIDGIIDRLDGHDQNFKSIDERFEKMDERFEKMDERFEKMDERMDSLENDVKSIKLTLENEINPKIQMVAEGHLDLARKMEELLEHESQIEMLELHVKYIEMNMKNDKLKTTNA